MFDVAMAMENDSATAGLSTNSGSIGDLNIPSSRTFVTPDSSSPETYLPPRDFEILQGGECDPFRPRFPSQCRGGRRSLRSVPSHTESGGWTRGDILPCHASPSASLLPGSSEISSEWFAEALDGSMPRRQCASPTA